MLCYNLIKSEINNVHYGDFVFISLRNVKTA